MNKDKLITIRIEASKRDKFKEWVKVRNLDVSEFLTTVISACLDGKLDEKLVTDLNSQSEDIRIDKLEGQMSMLVKKLDNCIDKVDQAEQERSLFRQQLSELSQKEETKAHQEIDEVVIESDNLKQQSDEQITHAELARRMGVASATVSRWANKKRQPPKNLEWQYDSLLKRWVKKS